MKQRRPTAELRAIVDRYCEALDTEDWGGYEECVTVSQKRLGVAKMLCTTGHLNRLELRVLLRAYRRTVIRRNRRRAKHPMVTWPSIPVAIVQALQGNLLERQFRENMETLASFSKPIDFRRPRVVMTATHSRYKKAQIIDLSSEGLPAPAPETEPHDNR